jgi:hypothetical protein
MRREGGSAEGGLIRRFVGTELSTSCGENSGKGMTGIDLPMEKKRIYANESGQAGVQEGQKAKTFGREKASELAGEMGSWNGSARKIRLAGFQDRIT